VPKSKNTLHNLSFTNFSLNSYIENTFQNHIILFKVAKVLD